MVELVEMLGSELPELEVAEVREEMQLREALVAL